MLKSLDAHEPSAANFYLPFYRVRRQACSRFGWPNLRDRGLRRVSRTQSGADGRDLCVFLLLMASDSTIAGSPYDRDLPYVTHGNALPRRTLRRPGPSWRSTRSPRSTRDGRRAVDESTPPEPLSKPHTRRTRTLPLSLRASTESARREAHDDPGIRN